VRMEERYRRGKPLHVHTRDENGQPTIAIAEAPRQFALTAPQTPVDQPVPERVCQAELVFPWVGAQWKRLPRAPVCSFNHRRGLRTLACARRSRRRMALA
jgi:hypothetical protein